MIDDRCGICGARLGHGTTPDDVRRMTSHTRSCMDRNGATLVEKQFNCDTCDETWTEVMNYSNCPTCGESIQGV